MALRTAKRGPRAGNQFWGCTDYPSCKGTRPLEEDSSAETQAPIKSSSQTGREPDTVGMQRRWWAPVHAKSTDETASLPNAVCIIPPEMRLCPPLEDRQAIALHIAWKVLSIERLIETSPAPVVEAERWQTEPWKSPDGSREEEQFFEILLSKLCMPGQYLHLWRQDWIYSNTGDRDDRRIDFTFVPPGNQQWLAFEIDGLQHHEAPVAAADKTKDFKIEKAGGTVIRIPAVEVRNGRGPHLEKVREALAAFGLSAINPPRGWLMRMAEASLMRCLEAGLLDPAAPSWQLSGFEPLTKEIEEGLRSGVQLLRKLEELYGCTLVPPTIEIGNQEHGTHAGQHIFHYEPGVPWYASPSATASEQGHIRLRPVYRPGSFLPPAPPTCISLPVSQPSRELLEYFLGKCFYPMHEFLEGQFEALERILRGEDTLVLLPTGAGKSIIFQLASVLLPGLTIVVEPLVSLMQDQIYNLYKRGFHMAASISRATTTSGQTEEVLAQVKDGRISLLYVSPERYQTQAFRDALAQSLTYMPIPIVVVDEAHCVSEWGHDFRPAYLNLGRNARRYGGWRNPTRRPAIVGLTGTASRAVLRDMQRELEIEDLEAVVTPTDFYRKELHFAVHGTQASEKRNVLAGCVRSIARTLSESVDGLFHKRGEETTCGIVFCPHVRGPYGVIQVAEYLRTEWGAEVECYSGGGMDEYQKQRVADGFRANEFPVLVATKAFGMGIDKPNVRYTIHLDLPASLEAFYQEAGRAGRGRQDSACHIVVEELHSRDLAHLLHPGVSLEEVREEYETKRRLQTDLIRILYFHLNSFLGPQDELGAIERLLRDTRYGGMANPASHDLGEGDTRTLREKAIHRLILLGVIDDYTINYASGTVVVHYSEWHPDRLKRSLRKYFSAYSRTRADELLRQIEQSGLPEDPLRAIMSAANVLTEFVYETVEAGRRNAIGSMWRWAASGQTSEGLWQDLLAYLQESEDTRKIEETLRTDEMNLQKWGEILERPASAREARDLAAAVGRFLEDYPDHPILLSVAGCLALICNEPDAKSYFEGACREMKSKYGPSQFEEDRFPLWLLEQASRRPTGSGALPEVARVIAAYASSSFLLRAEAAGMPSAILSGLLPAALRHLNQSLTKVLV